MYVVYSLCYNTGAIGSVDCTHTYWGRCPALFSNTYSGKEKKPTVSYEVTVNYSGRVLYISTGHPRSRNDKIIVKQCSSQLLAMYPSVTVTISQ